MVLGGLLPGLDRIHDDRPSDRVTTTRASNILLNCSPNTWSDLAGQSADTLGTWRNAGPTAVAEIIAVAVRAWAHVDLDGNTAEQAGEAPHPSPATRGRQFDGTRTDPEPPPASLPGALVLPLPESGLKTRTSNALRQHGLRTLGDLARLAADQLASVPGLGERGIAEIRQILAAHGLTSETRDAHDGPLGRAITEREAAPAGRARPLDTPAAPSPRTRAMIEMRLTGRTLHEIGEHFGVSSERIRQILHANGVGSARVAAAVRAHAMTSIARQEKRLIELFREGREISEIAAVVGVTTDQLREALRGRATAADRAARRARRSRSSVAYTDADLLQAIHRVADELGDVPTSANYRRLARQLGLPSLPTITNRLGSWNQAVRASGMTPNTTHDGYTRRWTSEACWRALARLVTELGDAPTAEQYELIAAANDDLPSIATARNRLGRWSDIVDRLLSSHDHPILGPLGIAPDAAPDERDERILLAYLADEITDEDLVRLSDEGVFSWHDAFGDRPTCLRAED
ncbi:MAG: homing endonuclease associated repeat-containing protein [Solirubrobacteraceae bacterium]